MSKLRFCSPEGTEIAPQEWLRLWAARYPGDKYNEEGHDSVIAKAKHQRLSATDFEWIGRWKDAAHSDKKWNPNVASVAYHIWKQAAFELPSCPAQARTADFLEDWSGRKCTYKYTKTEIQKRFGLSRATALLYFISGGRFPIFDSRVRKAVERLFNSTGGNKPPNSVSWYLDSYCPLFQVISSHCGTADFRTVDKALFSFGKRKLQFTS